MRNWPAGFITELAKKTGLTPCLILRTTIDSVVYHISDHVITFPAGALGGFANVSTKAWVATWGQIHEQISGNIGEILIADMALTMLVDQADANNIRHLALQHELEKNPTELYLWLPSLDATLIPPQLVTKGHIEDIDLPDETQVNITIEDETSRLQDYLGTKITSEAYPLCDPDAVGKMIPIVIGNVPKLPALCVDSGWVSSIVGDLTDVATALTVSELPAYPLTNKSITIDDEILLITAQGSNYSDYNWARATNGAVATAQNWHTNGTLLYPPSNAINGDRTGAQIGGTGIWYSGFVVPQWFQVDFAGVKLINEVSVFSIQDSYSNPIEPTEATTFTLYGLTAFNVQSWDGAAWVTQATVTGNDKVWKKVTFAPVSTDRIRINITAAGDSHCRITEVEAWLNTTLLTLGKTLTVLRAQAGSLKMLHTKGSTVIEKKSTPLVYLCADHALDAMGIVMARVRGVNVDITTDVTKYLGTPGNQHPAYPGKAAITISDFFRVSQRISITLSGNVSASDPGHGHNAGALTGSSSITQAATGGTSTRTLVSFYWTAVANQNRFPGSQAANVHSVYFPAPPGTPTSGTMSASVTVYLAATGGYWYLQCGNRVVTPFYSNGVVAWSPAITHDATSIQGNTLTLVVAAYASGQSSSLTAYGEGCIHSASRTVQYNTAQAITISPRGTGITIANTLGLSGNSVADIMIGDQILVDCTANNNTPAETFSRLLSTYCNDTSLVQTGTLPDYYKFNGAITEYKKKIEWFDILAFQARCWYRKIAGVSKLIVRKAEPVNPVTIPACCLTAEGIKDLRYKKAPKSDVINVINVLYNRDWSSNNSSAEAYMSSKPSTDDVSIADYGILEQPNMFMFDFVTSDPMASDVGTFYHDFYAIRKWLIPFSTYLDWAHLEFADDVLLPFANDLTGVIVEAGLDLSSGEQMPKIAFTIATTKIPLEVANGIHTLLGIQIHAKNREAATYV